MKKILISSTTDLATDQRVLRIAGSFQNIGWRVILIGRRLPDSQEIKDLSAKAIRFRMIFKKGFLFYICYNIRLFFLLLFTRASLLWSNDLDTLAPNFFVSKLKAIPVIYDSHEYFTEVPELIHRPIKRRIWLWLEQLLVPKLKIMTTVSDPIAKSYTQKYGLNVTVLRNFPLCSVESLLDPASFDSGNMKVILYQGTLNKNRGIELMIRAMHFIPEAIFIIIGSGPEEKSLQALIEDSGLEGQVKMYPRKQPAELRRYTPSASLGISLEEPVGLNYQYALPNKIFDYIYARIPVLVAPHSEMVKIVEEYKTGKVLESYDPRSIARQARELLFMEEKERMNMQTNLEIAAHLFCWEKEEVKLYELLKNQNI